jgi:hypothetical protein
MNTNESLLEELRHQYEATQAPPPDRAAAPAPRPLELDRARGALTGAPIAKERCAAIAGACVAAHGGSVGRAAGRFSLLGTTELIRRAAVFVTGDTLASELRAFVRESGRRVIEKPFLPSEVRRVVADVASNACAR